MPLSDRLMGEDAAYLVPETLKGERMSHTFFRTAQGRLLKLLSSKGKTTFFFGSYKMRSDVLFFYGPRKSSYGFLVK